MLLYNPKSCYPSSEELPDSDDTPVDNQLQHLIPGLLESILAIIWSERMDWFFGVDMGIYYAPEKPPIVPDGFLSLGVTRIIDSDLRLSYPLWEEKTIPILTLEIVSQTLRGEYVEKKNQYAEMGVLYYVIYAPRRKRKARLEIHKLNQGVYELVATDNPYFMSEIGLGIGTETGMYQGIKREWLYWYNQELKRFLTPEETAQKAEQERKIAEQKAARLAERLRLLGIDPDTL